MGLPEDLRDAAERLREAEVRVAWDVVDVLEALLDAVEEDER